MHKPDLYFARPRRRFSIGCFCPIAALLKQLHSLLCACFSALLSNKKQLAIKSASVTVRSINRYRQSIRYWLPVVLISIALKQYYRMAGSEDLQWLLVPIVWVLQGLSDLDFQVTQDYRWVDNNRQIAMVKACAGINFMIISLLAYFYLRQDKRLNWQHFAVALLSAWWITVLANSTRILISVYGQQELMRLLTVSEADTHRLIGILTYFSFVCIQLSQFNPLHLINRVWVAVIIYCTVTVCLPLLKSCLPGMEAISLNYLIWVGLIPILLAVAVKLTWKLCEV